VNIAVLCHVMSSSVEEIYRHTSNW